MSENIFKNLKSFTFFKFCSGLFISKYSTFLAFKFPNKKYSTIEINKKVNVFELLKPIEIQHSLIIKTILDPKGDHGCGHKFLELFFEEFELTKEIEVSDNWEVTAEKERYDIRIRNIDDTKIIIIENKSNWAKDQENQIYRYWYDGIYSKQKEIGEKELFSRIFYLIPDYRQPTLQSISRPKNDDRYKDGDNEVPKELIKIVYFYEHIVNWLEECIIHIKEKDNNNEFYYFLTQYRDFWRL